MQTGILRGIGARIVLEVEEERALRGPAADGGFVHEGLQVEHEAGMDSRDARGMCQHFAVLINL